MTDSHRDPSHLTSREVGHRRKPGAVRTGRLLLLGGALATTAAVAVASFVLPREVATAAPATAAVVTSSLPTVSAPSTAPSTGPTASAARKAAPKKAAPTTAAPTAAPAPPSGSGSGQRIVFDQSDQRVWLIESDGKVDRTYLVSGSRFANLKPGSYQVQSKQRHATSFDYTGSMEYFIRFATGFSAPIGFHAIPVYNNGKLEQSVAELGQPLSAGCIRQKKSDAKYLWDWAPIGMPVVVTA